MSDILNVTIDPILPDINYMVKNHIETCVRKFNKQFIHAQIREHKQKIRVLEKQLEMLDSDAFDYTAATQTGDVSEISEEEQENEEERQYQMQQENIQLSIDEIEKDVSDGKEDNEIKVKRTTSNYFQSVEKSNEIAKIEYVQTGSEVDDDLYGDNVETKELTKSDNNVPVCVESFEQFRADKQSNNDNTVIHSSVVSVEKENHIESTEEGQGPEEDDEEEEEQNEEDEEVVGVFEIEIDDKAYFTTDEINGTLYEIDDDGEPGNEVGKLNNGSPVFNDNGLPSQ